MAMRRSRIKMAPNLGAKARGPAAAAASGANRAVVKVEVVASDSTTEYAFVAAEAATTLTSIKPVPFSPMEELATSPIQEVEIITKAEPAEKAAVQAPEVDQFGVVADQDEDSTNIVPAEVLKGVSKITAITAVGMVQVTTDSRQQLPAEQEKDVNRLGTTPPRVRNRFPRAKPNLTETGRGRIRHNSVSRSDDEEMRSPPAIQRAITRPRQPSISETIPSPQKPQAEKEEQMTQAVLPCVVSVPEPTIPKVIKVPNTNNSLGIDLGYNTKRVVKTEKDDETRKKSKKQERIEGPIDKTKITMRDLIHMNPVGTPMKSTLAEKERRRKARERQRTRNGEGGDADDAQSIVSTATLQEEQAERAELDVTEMPEEAAADQSDAPTKPEPDEDELSAVPQVRIGANGEIILNESSLFIDNKDPDQDMKAASMELIHESDFSIPSFSYGRKTSSRLWTEMETKKFYLALSAVGTDFSLMINLFPKRTRTELKRKFKREEKSNRYLVDRAIREQQHFDQEFFDNLAKLQIDEPVPKKRRKEMKAEDDSRENQENQAEFGEQSKKKKAPAKVKEEKEAEKAEGAKKKRGRKPKEPNVESDTPEDTDKPTRPKRARKKKKLSYMESDEGGNTADEATVKDVNTTEPVPGCSNEGEDVQSNPVTMEGLPDGLKLGKPKRKRKQKVGKKEAKGKDVSPGDAEPVVDITELSDLIETNDKDPEEPQEASYVFVATTPRPDDPGSSTDPVIHVYLVSPPAVGCTEHPQSTAKVSHHPTPSPMSSPLRSPPHVPAALADQLNTGFTADIPGKETENTVIDITVDETEDNVTESTVTSVTVENNVTDLDERNAVTSVTASDVTDLNERNDVTSVTASTDSVSAEVNTVTNSETNNTVTDSTEGSVTALSEETVDVVKDVAVELTTNHVQTLDTVAQENSSSANVISSDHVSADDIVEENASESACAPPQPLNAIKEASLEAPSALRQSESESINSKTSENTNDVTSSANTMQSNSSTGNTAVAGGGASDKPPPMTGRRRRITAMPKIPVGKRRQGGPVNIPQRPQPSAKPPVEDADDSAIPPIDDLTAGGILLAMSTSAQSK